jgi:glycosyltransferase involved in cell wall biosynthesis
VKNVVILSVIIIARNEEETIGSSIQSVINAAQYASNFVKSYEIILVDSNSTDRTVEIASRFPITILQLKEQYIGVSVGRHVGYKYAGERCGKYVLFLDGDIVLPENWLLNAVQYMNQNPNVAGVSGFLAIIRIDDGSEPFVRHVKTETNSHVYGLPKKYLNGAVLYTKKILKRVGDFDPWFRGEEERELGFRIRQANFELHQLNTPQAIHLIKKQKTHLMHGVRYCQGIGQVIRANTRTALTVDLLRQYWFRFLLPVWILLNSTIFLLNYLGIIPSSFWLMLFFVNVLVFLIMVKVKHGFKKTICELCRSILASFSILVGLIVGKPRQVALSNDAVKLLKKGVVLRTSPTRYRASSKRGEEGAHSTG